MLSFERTIPGRVMQHFKCLSKIAILIKTMSGTSFDMKEVFSADFKEKTKDFIWY